MFDKLQEQKRDISSSVIREAIESGDMEAIEELNKAIDRFIK